MAALRPIRVRHTNRLARFAVVVDVQRVIHLRDKIKKPKEEVVVEEHALEAHAKPRSYSTGLNSDSERKWNKNAKEGSAKLLKALNAFFEKRMLEKHIAEAEQNT
jgi:hypothetical protein